MGLEAVEYVKQAEEKIEELRKNSQSEARKIVLDAEKTIQHNKDVLEQELKEFEKAEKAKYNTLLAKDQQVIADEVAQETKKIQLVVEKNKDEVVNDILKVVFTRYGNS
ncbi:hypothetical protein JTF06_01900 [Desemzia sp. RIT804]|uniref:hypothetical protein n=1 Tax=Desemzia sp. RIT 804 TaxID=2810209 RepID=UPI001952545B|nr:hypothetical protein [Desemzia sp. RIT 804]MBM6613644.1 hypothetical protein [Desemzia sp. RIT 804]